MIDALVDAGHPVKVSCRVLGVSSPGYYQYKTRPMSPTKMRRQWLTGLIREVHDASRKTYGSRRVHAELTRGMGIAVSVNLVGELMRLAEIAGLPGPVKVKRLKGVATADDLSTGSSIDPYLPRDNQYQGPFSGGAERFHP